MSVNVEIYNNLTGGLYTRRAYAETPRVHDILTIGGSHFTVQAVRWSDGGTHIGFPKLYIQKTIIGESYV